MERDAEKMRALRENRAPLEKIGEKNAAPAVPLAIEMSERTSHASKIPVFRAGATRALATLGLALLASACADPAPPARAPVAPTSTPTSAPRPPSAPVGPSAYTPDGPTYEEALDVPEDLLATKAAPELSNQDLGKPLASAGALESCNAPADTKVVVKIAVVDGRAAGVTVATKPDDPELALCIDKAVRQLVWPKSAKRFAFTTVY